MPCINAAIEFLKSQRLNIYILLATIAILSMNYTLYKHTKALQSQLRAHQTQINLIRHWNHQLDADIESIKNKCIID